jgi:hypothetical protein
VTARLRLSAAGALQHAAGASRTQFVHAVRGMHAKYSANTPRSVGCWQEWTSKSRRDSSGTGYDSRAEVVEGVSGRAGG